MRSGGNNMKKIVGIIVCMLFLFSVLPVVASNDFDKNNENSFLKLNDNINHGVFWILYGKIIYNGIVDIDSEKHYNISIIDVKFLIFSWDSENGSHFEKGQHEGGYIFMEKGSFLCHGILTKNYIFYCNGYIH